jgi:hypothetical protein
MGELYLNMANAENYATEVDIFREEMKSRLQDWTGNKEHTYRDSAQMIPNRDNSSTYQGREVKGKVVPVLN